MIRGGSRPGRVGQAAVCAVAAIALAAPAAASGQAAVDEYTLDLPQAGGGGAPVDPDNPTGTGVTASGGGGAAGGGDGAGGAGGGDVKSDARKGEPQPQIDFAAFHEGIGAQTLDTNSRSAPEIVADSLLDGPMLPILAALALITAAGAWRVVRGRRTLTGQAG